MIPTYANQPNCGDFNPMKPQSPASCCSKALGAQLHQFIRIPRRIRWPHPSKTFKKRLVDAIPLRLGSMHSISKFIVLLSKGWATKLTPMGKIPRFMHNPQKCQPHYGEHCAVPPTGVKLTSGHFRKLWFILGLNFPYQQWFSARFHWLNVPKESFYAIPSGNLT